MKAPRLETAFFRVRSHGENIADFIKNLLCRLRDWIAGCGRLASGQWPPRALDWRGPVKVFQGADCARLVNAQTLRKRKGACKGYRQPGTFCRTRKRRLRRSGCPAEFLQSMPRRLLVVTLRRSRAPCPGAFHPAEGWIRRRAGSGQSACRTCPATHPHCPET